MSILYLCSWVKPIEDVKSNHRSFFLHAHPLSQVTVCHSHVTLVTPLQGPVTSQHSFSGSEKMKESQFSGMCNVNPWIIKNEGSYMLARSYLANQSSS